MKKSILLTFLLLFSFLFFKATAQIGIGTSTPDKSAVLDVTGSDKGFLAPRMSSSQRKAIASPAKGLMVFDNDSSYFFYYDGNSWKSMRTVSVLSPWHRTGNKVLLNNNADSVGIGKIPKYVLDIKNAANVDSFYMISGQSVLSIKGGKNLFVGQASGKNNTGSVNQFSGYQSGYSNTSGDSNLFNGYQSGYSNTTGIFNSFSGYKAGFSNTTGTQDVFIGPESGYSNTIGSDNYFAGVQAGYSNTTGSINYLSGYHAGFSNTTGSTNIFIGFNAGYTNTTGNSNLFIGTGAGYFNSTASNNLFMGLQSGFSNSTGSLNQFIGQQTGYGNTSGSNNLFHGYQAGNKNTIGSNNQFVGYQAGFKNTTGISNCYSGCLSGYSNFSGSYNTAAGDSAGLTNTGSYNTFIGYYADASTPGVSNAAAIGNGARVYASNLMTFGNASVTGWAFGLNSVSSGHALEVGSNSTNGNGAYLTMGGTWTNASDRNKKENFTKLDSRDILDKISQLSIPQWNYKGENKTIKHIGPMAQDFYALFHAGNDSLSISTIDPAGVALIGLQELKKENETLRSELDAVKRQNEALKASSEMQNKKMEILSSEIVEIKSLLKTYAATGNTSANVSH
jgi:hypothetical protein